MQFHEITTIHDIDVLYDLLSERTPNESISHIEMPSYEEHVKFVESEPYREWWLVVEHNIAVGSCYISKTNEVGVAVFKKYRKQGLGAKILEELMSRYHEDLLANINPKNEKSIKMFLKAGFKHVQNTYQYSS